MITLIVLVAWSIILMAVAIERIKTALGLWQGGAQLSSSLMAALAAFTIASVFALWTNPITLMSIFMSLGFALICDVTGVFIEKFSIKEAIVAPSSITGTLKKAFKFTKVKLGNAFNKKPSVIETIAVPA